MAWFEAHEELPRHPKTLKLARALKKNKYETVGLLWCLFSWGLTAAQKDGSLPGMTADDIAMALDWPGKKAAELVESLLFSGYLEQGGDTYYIHDWYDYSGKLCERKAADKERKSAERARKKSGNSSACQQDIQRTSSGQNNGHPQDIRKMSQSPSLPPSPPLPSPPRTPYYPTPYYPPSSPSEQNIKQPLEGVVVFTEGSKMAEPVRRTDADTATDIEAVLVEIREAWNGLGLGAITPIDPMSARGAAVQLRLERFGKDGVLAAIAHVRESGFLRGDNDRGWRASFDWLMEETHCQRAIEGGYADFKAMAKPDAMEQRRELTVEAFESNKAVLQRWEARLNAQSHFTDGAADP